MPARAAESELAGIVRARQVSANLDWRIATGFDSKMATALRSARFAVSTLPLATDLASGSDSGSAARLALASASASDLAALLPLLLQWGLMLVKGSAAASELELALDSRMQSVVVSRSLSELVRQLTAAQSMAFRLVVAVPVSESEWSQAGKERHSVQRTPSARLRPARPNYLLFHPSRS